MAARSSSQKRPNSTNIFDVLYGFIPITEWEAKIIDSPFFQRLRWVKQLGLSNYIFPGAEHNRFAHAIGVMHSMHQMIQALDIGVPDHELFNRRTKNQAALLHKSLRIAALLHDIGTFPLSHAVEYAYLRHGNDQRRSRKNSKTGKPRVPKELPNSHEHLGSFIIKNTRYEGGLTQILEEYDFDIQLISDIIKGDSPYPIANQLMHSDLDADRMDYLLRDAHYTGIKYGQFDRHYILANLEPFKVGRKNTAFGIKQNAMHAVEDFLFARYCWYSQVIRNSDSAKFDVMATKLASAFLEKDLIYQFHDLLNMIEKRGERFFWWNDIYFITKCQEVRYKGLIRDQCIFELNKMLLYRKAPKTVQHPVFQHRILDRKNFETERRKIVQKIDQMVRKLELIIHNDGTGKEWILVDIPDKDVAFTTRYDLATKKRRGDQLYLERDPVKIINRDGSPTLLVERENSIMKHLSNFVNFVPNIYANDSAIRLFKRKKIIK